MSDDTNLILCVCMTIFIAWRVVGRSRIGFVASRLIVLGKQSHEQGRYAARRNGYIAGLWRCGSVLSDLTIRMWRWSLTGSE